MRSVYSKTLYQKRFMAVGWFIGVTAVVMLTMSVYNSFSNGAIGDSLQSLPPAIQSWPEMPPVSRQLVVTYHSRFSHYGCRCC